MERDEVIQIVNNFWNQTPADVPKWNFSKSWKEAVLDKVINKYSAVDTKITIKQYTRDIHEKKFENLRKELLVIAKSIWANSLRIDEIEDVVNKEWEEFGDSYNPELSNEKTYLNIRIQSRLKNIHRQGKRSHGEQFPEMGEEMSEPAFKNYLNDLLHRGDESLNYFLKYLIIIKPRIVNEISLEEDLVSINHSIPSSEFLFKDLPDELKFLKEFKDYRLHVDGYWRYEIIIKSKEREFMRLAIDALKECRQNFYSVILPELEIKKENRQDVIRKVPLLSAVAVDKDGGLITTKYKGETGFIHEHCEYTLFKEFLGSIDKQRISGGTLYVTLEPCNKRGFYVENGEEYPKIPCAVRCVESGISRIFIGTYDPDITVKWKGATTLYTGTYSFDIDENKNFVADNDEDNKALSLLAKYFDSKGYSNKIDGMKKIYEIGKSVELNLFSPDIALEIIKLNKEFLKGKEKECFIEIY